MQDWKAILRELRRDIISKEREAEREAKRKAQAESAREYLDQSPARGLLTLVKKRGDHKGEVVDLTPKQFRALLGYSPRQAVLNKRGNVPWEYCFDQVATERGFGSDEELKREIEFSARLRRASR